MILEKISDGLDDFKRYADLNKQLQNLHEPKVEKEEEEKDSLEEENIALQNKIEILKH